MIFRSLILGIFFMYTQKNGDKEPIQRNSNRLVLVFMCLYTNKKYRVKKSNHL